jgi:hypothetical protein
MKTTLERRRGAYGEHHLLQHFTGREMSRKPGLSGGTKCASHSTARLTRHTDRYPVVVRHQYRLDRRSIEKTEDPLSCRPVITLHVVHYFQAHWELFGQT